MREIERGELTGQLGQELDINREPTVELLGSILEKLDKYGPLSEPSFRRPG